MDVLVNKGESTFNRLRRRIEMKKEGLIFIFALLMMLFTFSLLTQKARSAEPTGAPVKIGGALALTGFWGENGKWMKGGFDFWLRDINKKGGLLGRPVEMVIYDNEGSPEKAVTYYERVITIDKADLLTGSSPSLPFAAIMPLAEKYKKVFIGQGAQMQSFERGYTYSFGSPPLMGIWGNRALTGIIEDLIPKADWPKSIAVFAMNDLASQPKRTAIIKWAEDHGIKVVVDESYNPPLSNATPLVNKAKLKGAEILACFCAFDDGVMITRACKAQRYNPKIIFHQVASRTPAWMKEMGTDGNNVVGEAFWAPDLPYPGNNEINQGAKEQYGVPQAPDFFALGYCWMRTLELGVLGAGTLDNEKIRDYLKSHKIDLPYGRGILFDSRGLPPPVSFALQTTSGRNKTIWPKEVATDKFVYPRPPWSE
jgi:branched-chain amino acid transport system substrate-binding protein